MGVECINIAFLLTVTFPKDLAKCLLLFTNGAGICSWIRLRHGINTCLFEEFMNSPVVICHLGLTEIDADCPSHVGSEFSP